MLLSLFVIVIILAGVVGGALSGLGIAGKDLGRQLAAMMGVFYGLTAAAPAAMVALLYFAYLTHRG